MLQGAQRRMRYCSQSSAPSLSLPPQGARVPREASAPHVRSSRLGGTRVMATAAVPAVKAQSYQPPKEIHGFELVSTLPITRVPSPTACY